MSVPSISLEKLQEQILFCRKNTCSTVDTRMRMASAIPSGTTAFITVQMIMPVQCRCGHQGHGPCLQTETRQTFRTGGYAWSGRKRIAGSYRYATHPTVPLGTIVTILNGDMIGRNHPNSAAILCVQAPHRNSTKLLVQVAMDANQEGPRFKLDTLWDKPAHPEGWYFRSDHLPYARLGIPSLMYTTLLHPDYQTLINNAQNIHYAKLKKMAEWMYRTRWKVAMAPQRPATDPGFKPGDRPLYANYGRSLISLTFATHGTEKTDSFRSH